MITFNRLLTVLMVAGTLLPRNAMSQTALDHYIDDALQSNLALQQKQISFAQAENGLRIARNSFLPSVQLLGDYTSGEGGRAIDIPIGDLLNPVYRSLNQITQSDQFPQVENVKQNFFPKNFYDAKVRTTLPIVNTDLIVNRTIQSKKLVMAEFDLKLYKRQLIYEVTEAYYRHLSAVEAVKIYENALVIVERNVAVTESLKRNGKGLPAQVLRAKSEYEKVKADLYHAQNVLGNSKRYFNLLLNRPLDTEVSTAYTSQAPDPVDSATYQTDAREELAMSRLNREIADAALRLSQYKRLPKLSAFLDLGSQASDWKFNDQSQYYLLGVQLSIPLFQGFTNQINVNQSKLEVQKASLATQQLNQSLDLAAQSALSDYRNALANYHAAQEQLKAAESYFNLIDIGYREGLNSLIEFLDARNQLTTSSINKTVREFESLIAKAKLDRETASYNFNK